MERRRRNEGEKVKDATELAWKIENGTISQAITRGL